MRMSYEERKHQNRRKAEIIVRFIERMINKPEDTQTPHDLAELLSDILNHEDRYLFR